jgi:hypothetical protein
MTRASAIHVVTGLEIGGAEVRLFELCREEIRAEREVAAASLISQGPMRYRFQQIGIDVTGLGMRRGEFFAPAALVS